METFASSMSMLHASHHRHFTQPQQTILLQLALVLVTSPSFYLPNSTPFQDVTSLGQTEADGGPQTLVAAVRACTTDSESQRSETTVNTALSSADEDREVFSFAERSPEALWSWQSRLDGSSSQGYSKAAVPMKQFVDVHQSQNLEVRSVQSTLRAIRSDSDTSIEDIIKGALGAAQSPTHRTMLHISSAKLTPVQSNVFSLLEETQFLEPRLAVMFLCQLCAIFLDIRRVVLDSNKVALAARSLALLVLFLSTHLLAKLGVFVTGFTQCCHTGRQSDNA
jgi:hypothetical protein